MNVSGTLELLFDSRKPKGSQIVSLKLNGVEVVDAKVYRGVVNSFTAGGGDNHVVLKEFKGKRYDTGLVDVDVLIEFIKQNAPTDRKSEGRVRDVAK